MKALRLTALGQPPVLMDVAEPVPGGRQVLVQVDAAGMCHSDVHLIEASETARPFAPPFTLGHEVAGHIAALGPDVDDDLAVGDAVVVHGPWGCGHCDRCRQGCENYCTNRTVLRSMGMGFGQDGGMAEAVLVPDYRHLVPIGDLDPVQAAPLTDAGLTPFHAIRGCQDRLGEGAIAIVVGVGGLGHLAVQILRATTPARVIALDTREDALALAEQCGADLSVDVGPDIDARLQAATNRGADVIFDFVGSSTTLAMAARNLRSGGELVVVGSAGGELLLRKPLLPLGFRAWLPVWGSRRELVEVVELAKRGALQVEVATFPLEAADEALDGIRSGRLRGRAVLVPLPACEEI